MVSYGRSHGMVNRDRPFHSGLHPKGGDIVRIRLGGDARVGDRQRRGEPALLGGQFKVRQRDAQVDPLDIPSAVAVALAALFIKMYRVPAYDDAPRLLVDRGRPKANGFQRIEKRPRRFGRKRPCA